MSKSYGLTKFACYVGYVVQAVINNFLPILFIALQDNYKFTYEQLARLIAINFIAQIFTDILTPKVVTKIGYKRAAVICQGVSALGLMLMGILPNVMSNTYLGIIISIVVYACGSGLIEVIISPIIENLPIDNKSGNMAFLHSFYCWGQAFTIIVTTLLIGVLGFAKWSFVPLIWSVIPLFNIFIFFKATVVEPKKADKKATFKELFARKNFRFYMIMMLCAGAAEIAMAEWASLFAQQALGVSKMVGDLAGPCAFAIFMASGRVWYSRVADKISFRKTLIVLNAICCALYLIVAFCNIPAVSLVCCALCGFTVSIAWPGILSSGAKRFTDGASVMYGVFAMCGDTGCCLGPWMLGIVADFFGLNLGFAAAAVFPLLMVVAAFLSIKNSSCKKAQ